MKILYIDLEYSYGKKEWGLNYIGQNGFFDNFIKLGYDTYAFYYDAYLSNNNKLQQDVISFTDKIKPDIIFFSLYTDQFKKKTLDYLKSKYITVCWFGDDTWRFDNFTVYYAPHFTWCVTTDKYSLSKYLNIGQKNVILSQWAAIDNFNLPPLNVPYEYDVSFIGAISDYRQWFISELGKRGIKVAVFGNGWEHGIISVEKMNEIFIKSKINLNISNSVVYDMRFFLTKKSSFWLNIKTFVKIGLNLLDNVFPLNLGSTRFALYKEGQKNRGQIKARNFEIPYGGGFQLTDYVIGIEDYFDIGKEVVCYKDIDEAETMIKFFLENDFERENIKINGSRKAFLEHGYNNRIKIILREIGRRADFK